jgi:hypothetical protein
MIRGPRSRAGLIAYPVGPPSDMPIETTRNATRSVFRPPARTGPWKLPVKNRIPNTSTQVPTTSVTKFQK